MFTKLYNFFFKKKTDKRTEESTDSAITFGVISAETIKAGSIAVGSISLDLIRRKELLKEIEKARKQKKKSSHLTAELKEIESRIFR